MKKSILLSFLMCSFLHSFSQRCDKIYELGQKALDKDNYRLALETFNRAIDCDPSVAVVYNSRGVAKLSLADYDGALQNFNRCLEIDPTIYQTYQNIGMVYYEVRDWEKVVEISSTAIQINDRYANAYI